MGPDGDKSLLMQAELDDEGKVNKDAFIVEKLENNINADLFLQASKDCANSIRKAAKAMPAVLIDYEMGQLSSGSGEQLAQAVNFYNAVTQSSRNFLAEAMKDIFSNSVNETLANNKDWSLKAKTLNTYATNT